MFSFSPVNRWYKRYGSGRVYDDIRLELLHHINRRLSVQEDIKVVQTGCTCFQIFREIFHTGLARKV